MTEAFHMHIEPNEQNVPKPFEYELLVGHRRSDGTVKSGEQLRTEYLTRTDELIRQITEGVKVEDPTTHEITTEIPDDVVFLDKSARPLAWLTREMWPKHAASKDTVVPQMPKFSFVNIDRLQWVTTVDQNGTGLVDINKVDPNIIRSLRSVFVSPLDKAEGITPSIDRVPSSLDKHTILIVDEVQASGRTLEIAKKFFTKAFPTAKIAGTHWMGGVTMKGNAIGNADLPVWYRDDVTTGRGVGNRDDRASERSPSITQRLGGWFLSTRLPTPDPSSQQLRTELKQIAHDPDILVVPSLKRDEGDFEERAVRLNAMENFEEFIARKRRQDVQSHRRD